MSTQSMQTAVKAAIANPQYAVQAQETMGAIFSRSATDGAFRVKLLTDPQAALADFAGHAIPTSLNVRFVENHGTATFVLPPAIDPAAALSDEELETVAGGALPVIVVASSTNCIASALAVGAAIASWFD